MYGVQSSREIDQRVARGLGGLGVDPALFRVAGLTDHQQRAPFGRQVGMGLLRLLLGHVGRVARPSGRAAPRREQAPGVDVVAGVRESPEWLDGVEAPLQPHSAAASTAIAGLRFPLIRPEHTNHGAEWLKNRPGPISGC